MSRIVRSSLALTGAWVVIAYGSVPIVTAGLSLARGVGCGDSVLGGSVVALGVLIALVALGAASYVITRQLD